MYTLLLNLHSKQDADNLLDWVRERINTDYSPNPLPSRCQPVCATALQTDMSCILHVFSRFFAGVDGQKCKMYVLYGAGGLVHAFPDKCSKKTPTSFVEPEGLLLHSHQQATWAD